VSAPLDAFGRWAVRSNLDRVARGEVTASECVATLRANGYASVSDAVRDAVEAVEAVEVAPTVVYIGAANDANGNPRRGWIVGYGSAAPFFVDEGYSGVSQLAAFGVSRRQADDCPRIAVTPAEYRAWNNLARRAVEVAS